MELTECQAPVVWSNKRWHASRPQVVRLMSCIGMRTRPNMLNISGQFFSPQPLPRTRAIFQPRKTGIVAAQGNTSAQQDGHGCSTGQYFSPDPATTKTGIVAARHQLHRYTKQGIVFSPQPLMSLVLDSVPRPGTPTQDERAAPAPLPTPRHPPPPALPLSSSSVSCGFDPRKKLLLPHRRA